MRRAAALGSDYGRLLCAVLVVVVAFGLLRQQVDSAVSTATACAATPTRATESRALLLSAPEQDPVIEAWKHFLSREGIPFDTVQAGTAAALAARLAGSGRIGRYQFVIAAPGSREALPRAARRRLDVYERRFAVREVTAYGAPLASDGRPVPARARSLSGRARLTPTGRRSFPHLHPEIPLDRAPALIAGGRSAEGADALLQTPGGAPLVTAARLPDGRERLAVSVSTAVFLQHSRLLSHGIITWATRGVHVGMWRAYLAMEVDDILLPNARWDVGANRTSPAGRIDMDAGDVTAAARWGRRERFRLDMAFNGGGTERSKDGEACDAVLDALKAEVPAFGWENHTFNHLNFDALPADTLTEEIMRTIPYAEKHGLPIETRELITGEHSGLRNPQLPEALERADIRFLASDASRQPEQRRIGPALTVPRHAPNIYYDAGTRGEQVDQYNFRYLESCTRFCLSRPVDWDGYVRRVARDLAAFAFDNDPRPTYSHQSNLADDRILLTVMSATLRRIRSAVSAELLQPTLSEAGEQIRRADAWRAAVADGSVRAVVDARGITFRATRDLLAPVTGTEGARAYGGERSGWVRLPAGRTVSLRRAG